MDPSAILGMVMQAAEIFQLIKTIYRGVRDAPVTIQNLTAEAQCLRICLATLTYEGCLQALQKCSKDQVEDLEKILQGCKTNAEEMILYVDQIQWIVAENYSSTLVKQKGWRRIFRIPARAKKLWAKCDFALADHQPMRNKLAIPLQSLNIFLVGLTFTHVPYGLNLPHGRNPAPARLASDWTVVGQLVAFKSAKFDATDLAEEEVESRIIKAANCIIKGHCDSYCQPCCSCQPIGDDNLDDDGVFVPDDPSVSSQSLQSRSRIVTDQMYLVRRKSKRRGRSRATVRRVKREIVPPEYGFYGGEPGDSSPTFLRPSQPMVRNLRTLPSTNAGPVDDSFHGTSYESQTREPRPDSPSSTNAPEQEASTTKTPVLDQQAIEAAKRAGREAAKIARRHTARRARNELEHGVDITDKTYQDERAKIREDRHKEQEELDQREMRLHAEMRALREERSHRLQEAAAQQLQPTSPQARSRFSEEMRTRARSEVRQRRKIESELDECSEEKMRQTELEEMGDEYFVEADRPGVQTYMRLRYGLEIYAATAQSILISETFPQESTSLDDEAIPGFSDGSEDEDDDDSEADHDHFDSDYSHLYDRMSSAQKIMPESSEQERTHEEERRRALFTIPPHDYRPRVLPSYPSDTYDVKSGPASHSARGRYSTPYRSINVEKDGLEMERRRLSTRENELARREKKLWSEEHKIREKEKQKLQRQDYGEPSKSSEHQIRRTDYQDPRTDYQSDQISRQRYHTPRKPSRGKMDYHASYVSEDEDSWHEDDPPQIHRRERRGSRDIEIDFRERGAYRRGTYGSDED